MDSGAKTGTAACDWPVEIGMSDSAAHMIGIQVKGDYIRDSSDDDTIIVVSKPQINFVAGGGFLASQSTGGKYASDHGKRTDFGLMVKYIPGESKLSGWVNVMLRNGGRVYQVRTTSLSWLIADVYYPKNLSRAAPC